MDYQLITPLLPLRDDYTVVERVFAARGIAPENLDHYLHTTIEDIIDPGTIANIHAGAQMLIKHIYNEDKIFIQVDSDCDGYTSSALLINYLNSRFPGFAQNNISYRLHTGKQHGLILDTIPKNVKLVIAPDSSSNNYAEHEALHNAGIDVLVIDHHEAEKVSEYACVINNQLCDYPTKSLSGVGMVYKFCSYLDSLFGDNQADEFLDLVALGEIADVMDLRDYETKELIDRGLKGRLRNPFFKQMAKLQEFTISRAGGLNPYSIGFYIAPAINSMNRVGTDEQKKLLFESMLEFKAYEMIPSTKRGCAGQKETRVEQACRVCTGTKRNQDKLVENAVASINKLISDNNLLDNKILVIPLGDNYKIDRNLTGLIANKFAAKYQRPTILLTKTVEDYGICWEGSGRGFETKDFNDLRGFCRDSGLVALAEGHANACGINILDENLQAFIDYANTELENCTFTPCAIVDAVWHSYDFTANDVLEIAEYNDLWGQGLSQPQFLIENINVSPSAVTLMSPDKRPTLKIQLPNGVSLIHFGSSQKEYESFTSGVSENGATICSVVGTCACNEWGGNVTAQFMIKDYEITGKSQYYF